MLEADKKFEQVDVPLILAALHKARNSRMYAEVTIKISHEGGCLGVETQYREKIK
jgi:hypothetical protein